MHHRRIGAGRGPALFLLHGFASSGAFFADMAGRLSHHYDVIMPDWPGFGTSSKQAPLASIGDFAKAVLCLADQLQIQRFFVLGHSMSGFVVQQLLLEHADRLHGAILYGAGLKVHAARRFESLAETLRRVESLTPAELARDTIRHWLAQPETNTDLFDACLQAAQGMTRQAAVHAVRAFAQADYTGCLDQVETPALIILGEAERSHPPSSALELQRALPHSHLAILPFSGHAAHLEQPVLFERALLAFLQAGQSLP